MCTRVRAGELYRRAVDRRHLEYFLAVADSGSFTGAARALHVAQPSLSTSIAALERELGVQLFQRLGRGVRLTESGTAMLEPARRVLRSFALVQSAARSADEAGFGQISIMCSTLWALEPLVRIIGAFRLLHPSVQFTVVDPARRSEVLDSVRTGAVDFGLLETAPLSGALNSRWLIDQDLAAVLPVTSTPRSGPVTISDLIPLGLICTGTGTELRAIVDARLEEAGHRPEIAVETAHLAAVIPLVLAGAGAAVLPTGLATDAATKGARVVRFEPPSRFSTHIIWRAGGLTPLTEHFLNVAGDVTTEHPSHR